MNRGDRREPIMLGKADGKLFVDTLGEACAKTGWQIHAFGLTPQANLSAGMKWFLGTYTSRFNRRHKLFGHLFSGRYKSLLVDDRDGAYLQTVCQYVHLNPARAKLMKKTARLESYQWSSYPEYLLPPSKRRQWIRTDRLMGELGIGKDSTGGRRRFAEITERHESQLAHAEQIVARELKAAASPSGNCRTFRKVLKPRFGSRRDCVPKQSCRSRGSPNAWRWGVAATPRILSIRLPKGGTDWQ